MIQAMVLAGGRSVDLGLDDNQPILPGFGGNLAVEGFDVVAGDGIHQIAANRYNLPEGCVDDKFTAGREKIKTPSIVIVDLASRPTSSRAEEIPWTRGVIGDPMTNEVDVSYGMLAVINCLFDAARVAGGVGELIASASLVHHIGDEGRGPGMVAAGDIRTILHRTVLKPFPPIGQHPLPLTGVSLLSADA